MEVEQRQHLGHPRRLPRPRRQDRRREPAARPGRLIGALVVDPRCSHRHRTCCRGHFTFAMVAVAHDQPMTVLVELVSMCLDIGGNLGLQRRGQHLPRTVANDLIEQRGARRVVVGRGLVVDYLEHERTFPNRRANAGPDQTLILQRGSWALRVGDRLALRADASARVGVVIPFGDAAVGCCPVGSRSGDRSWACAIGMGHIQTMHVWAGISRTRSARNRSRSVANASRWGRRRRSVGAAAARGGPGGPRR